MFICPKCNVVFFTKFNLSRHLKKKTPCNQLDEDFIKDSGLMCPECNQTFSEIGPFKYHFEKNVCSKNFYFCSDDKCAAWFNSAIELEIHTKSKHLTNTTQTNPK
jgi:uncharacterized C2H2 Zn-finger protein